MFMHQTHTTSVVLQLSDGDKKSLSQTAHDTLADIFKKIGSKENTREVRRHLLETMQWQQHSRRPPGDRAAVKPRPPAHF